MTAAGAAQTTSRTWRALLPADRRYVVLPSRTNAILAADRDADVLDYVRRSLLARPPGTRLPGWVYEGARSALRAPALWRMVPSWRPDAAGRAGWEAAFAEWICRCGHRVVALEHSHDPDRRAVLLVFPESSGEPSLAVKVPGTPEATTRIAGERARLTQLGRTPLETVRGTVPRLVTLPVPDADDLLATTALRGEPMFVTYYRDGRTQNPDAVRGDFRAAEQWLAALQADATGEPAALRPADGIREAARAHLVDRPADRELVDACLLALDHRLAAHRCPQRIVHGDFWAGNLLLHDGAVSGVLDWERWEPAGSPIRDLGRFAVSYSLYLDRQTPRGRPVRGHPGLVAGSRTGGVGYALHGTGWYPATVRGFVARGLARLGLSSSLGPDVLLAELAATAAEATNPQFARGLWLTFAALARDPR